MSAIRRALATEAEAISALAIASKAHWGYTEEQMAVFQDELTLTGEDVVACDTHVLSDGEELLGFYTLCGPAVADAPEEAEARRSVMLEHLFIAPSRLREGHGARLFDHACRRARAAGFRTLEIQADPNAAGFYAGRGARIVREIPSSIPGRTIPFFEYTLVAAGA